MTTYEKCPKCKGLRFWCYTKYRQLVKVKIVDADGVEDEIIEDSVLDENSPDEHVCVKCGYSEIR